MAMWARQASRWCCLLNTACAVGLRSGGGPGRACRGFPPVAAGKERALCRLQAYTQVSAGGCSSPDSAKGGSLSSPESNLPSVQQERAKAETLPDLNAKILDEGKRL